MSLASSLTEINVTSPTCVQELDKQFGLNISGQLMDHIEAALKLMAKLAVFDTTNDLVTNNDRMLAALFLCGFSSSISIIVLGIRFHRA